MFSIKAKVCSKLSDIMDYLNCSGYELNRAWENALGENIMYVGNTKVIKSYQNGKLLFIIKE